MLAHRMMQQTLRRAAAQQTQLGTARALVPFQRRFAATASTTDDANSILAKQRLNRPVAPHLMIYKPQITWIPSMLNRLTGIILSGGFYLFGFAYLAAPAMGWHLDSASLAAAFATLGPITAATLKFTAALPFTFHSFNGLRHLMWDTGRQFGNLQVARTGWFVAGLTVVSALALAVYPF